MDKDRNKLNANNPGGSGRCKRPDTCIHLRSVRQQQMQTGPSAQVLYRMPNFQQTRSEEEIYFDCQSIGDNDNPKDGHSCKSGGSCRFDDPEVMRATLERAANATQMLLKNFEKNNNRSRQPCNATLEITARLITNPTSSNPDGQLQGRPITVQMPLEFDPNTGHLGSCQSNASRPICQRQQQQQPPNTGCPALMYMQDERSCPRDVTDATRSQKMQTDKSYLNEKRPPGKPNNRDDDESESSLRIVDTNSTVKPSQTDTSFLYDHYKRNKNGVENVSSQTNANTNTDTNPDTNPSPSPSPSPSPNPNPNPNPNTKQDRYGMGKIHYPTHYASDQFYENDNPQHPTSSGRGICSCGKQPIKIMSCRDDSESGVACSCQSKSGKSVCLCGKQPSPGTMSCRDNSESAMVCSCLTKSMPNISNQNMGNTSCYKSARSEPCEKTEAAESKDPTLFCSAASDANRPMDGESRVIFRSNISCQQKRSRSMDPSGTTCGLSGMRSAQSERTYRSAKAPSQDACSCGAPPNPCGSPSMRSAQSGRTYNTALAPSTDDCCRPVGPNPCGLPSIPPSAGPDVDCCSEEVPANPCGLPSMQTAHSGFTCQTAAAPSNDCCSGQVPAKPCGLPSMQTAHSGLTCQTAAAPSNDCCSEQAAANPCILAGMHSAESGHTCETAAAPSNDCCSQQAPANPSCHTTGATVPNAASCSMRSAQSGRAPDPSPCSVVFCPMSGKVTKAPVEESSPKSGQNICDCGDKSTMTANDWTSIETAGNKTSMGFTEPNSVRSQSVTAKVTCLCSEEQKAQLGQSAKKGNDGAPFHRIEESSMECDVTPAIPSLISDTGISSMEKGNPLAGQPISSHTQGTKVIFMKHDKFCDCRFSSNTSLLSKIAPEFVDEGCEDSEIGEPQSIQSKPQTKSASCICSRASSTQPKSSSYKSAETTMKSAVSCSCGKDDFKSTKSPTEPSKSWRSCDCYRKTSKYDVSVKNYSIEPETVGVVMTCNSSCCPDGSEYDDCCDSQQSTRARILNLVDMVTNTKDGKADRLDTVHQLIRELTLMLRQDEAEEKPIKLSYEDCMEAVTAGTKQKPKPKPPKTEEQLQLDKCLNQMEQYLETCFPVKRPIGETELVAFELDPDFDPYRRDRDDGTGYGSCASEFELQSCNDESKADVKSDSKSDSKSGSKCDSKSDSKSGSKSDSKSGSKSDSKSDSKSGSKSDSKSDGKSDSKSEVNSEWKSTASKSVDAPASAASVSNRGSVSGGTNRNSVASVSKRPSKSGSTASPPPKASDPGASAVSIVATRASPRNSKKSDTELGSPGNKKRSDSCLCEEEDSQRGKLPGASCDLCEVKPGDPLGSLTDRERLLCEYMLRRMCELCETDQDLDEEYEGDEDGDGDCRPPPNQAPCLCCHCRGIACDNQCKTVSKTLESVMYDPVAETKFFVDSIICDLQAMEHVMNKNKINPKPPRPSKSMGNAPGESFPVTITNVSSLGCRALYVRWELEDCAGIGGYEIYVDGHLTNRFYSFRHESGVVSNVDVTKSHQVVLRAQAVGQEFPEDECNGRSNAMVHPHPEMLVGAQQPWKPSVFLYEP